MVVGVVFPGLNSDVMADRWNAGHPWNPLHYVTLPAHDAIEALQAYLADRPWHVDAWHLLGHLYWQADNTESAIDAYSEAITITHRFHPLIHFEHSALWLYRALLEAGRGNQDIAEQALNNAIFQDHQNATALRIQNRGWQAEPLPEYRSHTLRARDYVAEIRRRTPEVEALPDDLRRHDEAIDRWEDGQPDKALRILNRLQSKYSDDHRLRLHRAMLLYELNECEAALEEIETALPHRHRTHQRYHRNAALHYYHRGLVHQATGLDSVAGIDFTRARDIDTSFDAPSKVLDSLNKKT